MLFRSPACLLAISLASWTHAKPFQRQFDKGDYFDVQGHRGGRGEAVENTLPAFAWGLISGANTLELDNGLSKDGVVIVWHDEEITSDKCRDTTPAVEDDPDFPYVGKHIANLTLAQIKTLDCGSLRAAAHPLQLTYPDTKLSTLPELFEFVHCVDPNRQVQWNIESKLNPVSPGSTRSVEDFVKAQHADFVKSGYPLSQITFQSFDWRSLIAMKKLDTRIPTSALIDPTKITPGENGVSPWLGGLNIDSFPGEDLGTKIAYAAKSIDAAILSPTAGSLPALFTTKQMVQQAYDLGISVKPWTVNSLDVAEQLVEWGVRGIISDYPTNIRRFIRQRGFSVAPGFSEKKVMACLNKHLQRV